MALKKPFRSPAESEFLFEIDETMLEETLTSYGGLSLFPRAARNLGAGERPAPSCVEEVQQGVWTKSLTSNRFSS